MMFPRWYTPPSLTRYTGREIIDRIAKLHDVEPVEVLGPSRLPELCEARRAIMRELRARGWSTPRIGRLLNRDHSTVVHGLRRAG